MLSCAIRRLGRWYSTDYRRALVRGFPYVIFYESAEGTVTAYGIFHTARDPAKWRQTVVLRLQDELIVRSTSIVPCRRTLKHAASQALHQIVDTASYLRIR